MVDLLGQMSESCPNPPGNALLLVLTNTRSMIWTLYNVLQWSTPTMAMSTSSLMSMPIMGKAIPFTPQVKLSATKKVDDKSVKVDGSQCITTRDGYSFPLKCTGGLMYLSILGKPTDEELVK